MPVTLQGNVRAVDGTPLVGKLVITSDRPRSSTAIAGATVVPSTRTINITAGTFSVTLEPTSLEGVTYKFELYENQGSPVVPVLVPGCPFWAQIPNEPTVSWDEIFNQTGEALDRLDSSIAAVSARIINSGGFWNTLLGEAFNNRGLYSVSATYTRGDLVLHNGSSYLYTFPSGTEGNTPPNATFWQPLAVKGDPGTGTGGNNDPFGISWDGQLDAPTRNAVYDYVSTLATIASVNTKWTLGTPIPSTSVLSALLGINDRSLSLATTQWVRDWLAGGVFQQHLPPIGSIVPYVGTSQPPGWYFCDGQLLNRISFAALFAVCGTQFNIGGEPGASFRLPDLRGRVTVGIGDTARWPGNTGVGVSGGSATTSLAIANLPPHTHGTPSGLGYLERASLSATSDFQPVVNTPGQLRYALETASAGSGTAFNTCPPWLGVQYLIRGEVLS